MESERQKFFRNKIKNDTRGTERNLRSKNDTKRGPENCSDMGVTILGSTSYFNQNKDNRIFSPSSGKENKLQTSLGHQQERKNNSSGNQVSSNSDSFKEQNNTVYDHVSKQASAEKSPTCENFQHGESNFINSPDNETVLERSDDSDYSIQFTHETITVEIEVEKINHSKENSTLENNSETDITGPNKNKQTTEELSKDISDINHNDIREERCITPVNYSYIDQRRREIDESLTNHLSPTFKEIIPENEMDLIRKSLENVNAEVDIDDSIFNLPEDESELEKPRSRKRKKTQINTNYVDFLSEDEDFVWDSTSWKETDDSSSDEEPVKKKKQNKRTQEEIVGDSGLKKKKLNKKKQRKTARAAGQEYVKRDGSISKARNMQANPCIGKTCGLKCEEITDEKRKCIFDHFWSLSIERRKDWIVAMSTKKQVKRKRCKDSTYRQNTFEYYINDGEGRRQVCLQFLLSTLDVTQRFVYYTVSNAESGSSKTESRGKTVPKNKTPEEVRTSAVNFIKSLPALPSHLCRKDSTRLYLSTELKSLKNLYRIYKEEVTSKGVDVINEKLFRNIFNDEYLGFHVPKKDKCIKCLKYEGKDKTTEEIITHLEEKKAGKSRLEFQRELPKNNPAIMCTSFDLQKVLNTPYGNSMLLYYSRKYAVFNLCFYESVTRNGFCYVWGETEGKRGGVEIASILQKYVEDVDQRKTIKNLILYSDSCAGQNKNKMVLAALHNALLNSENLESIQMNYLLPGHTEMTVDSIHSTIESSIRNTIVWAPSQWLTICQLARKDPKPYYYVQTLIHDEFKNYDDFSEKYFKGNLVGKISKVRIATFKKTTPNVMTVKYTMKNDAKKETIPITSKGTSLTSKYKASLPITKTKYNDLKKLCDTGVIPRVFHQEYLQFSKYNGQDVLIDTDVEDEVDNVE